MHRVDAPEQADQLRHGPGHGRRRVRLVSPVGAGADPPHGHRQGDRRTRDQRPVRQPPPGRTAPPPARHTTRDGQVGGGLDPRSEPRRPGLQQSLGIGAHTPKYAEAGSRVAESRDDP
jgi:hypothetical protein